VTSIRFGTDGWRGVIGEDFTEANCALVVDAAARVWEADEGGPRRPLVVGHDTRANSRRIAELAGDRLATRGWRVLLADRPVPTPAVSYAVTARGAAGGLVVTASHNPPRFNGIKLKGAFGGSAPPEFTARVEAALGGAGPPGGRAAGAVETVDLLPAYVARLGTRIAADRRPPRRLRVLGDALHGATGDLLAAVVPAAWAEVRVLHANPDPTFGGRHPEPIPPHLDPLAAEVRATGADMGLAMDGDGDRLGVIGPDGGYVSPATVMALLVRHLARGRGWRGEVAKGFAMGVQIDRACARLGLRLHVAPIGFKHLAALMRSRDILIAGEESGGMGFRDHLPERDGLLSSLLVLEAVVASGTTLDALLRDLEAEAGAAAYRRRDYTLPPDLGRALVARLDAAPPERIGSRAVTRCETLDGRKYWLGDGAWMLIRPSGTEPVLRVYVEAPTKEEVDELHAAAESLLGRLTAR
jgi:phosphomannomutase